MKRQLTVLAAVAATGIATLVPVSIAQAAQAAQATPQLTLPTPTGDSPVGHTTLHLVDEGRADPWAPDEDRELMVTMFYPARRPSEEPAPYMTVRESELYLADQGIDVPLDLLSTVTMNATVDAKPAKGRHTAPLVLLSAGFGRPRALISGLAEDLASRGYVVALIGHNYEASGTTFPDGHTTTCLACGRGEKVKLVENRALDVSFVVDELTGHHPAWKGAKLIDAEHIAMVGQSIGGASAIPTLLNDPRIDAGVNLDGSFYTAEGSQPAKPFLMFGSERHTPGFDRSWDLTWSGLSGWKRWLSVDGAQHASFTDAAPFGAQVGIPFQDLNGFRCLDITREYVGAFLDLHLRGVDRHLLDGPSATYPEVLFHSP